MLPCFSFLENLQWQSFSNGVLFNILLTIWGLKVTFSYKMLIKKLESGARTFIILHWTWTFGFSFFDFLRRKFTAENAIRTIVHFEYFLAWFIVEGLFSTTQFLLTFMNLIVLVTFFHFEIAFLFFVTRSLPMSWHEITLSSTSSTWVSNFQWIDITIISLKN